MNLLFVFICPLLPLAGALWNTFNKFPFWNFSNKLTSIRRVTSIGSDKMSLGPFELDKKIREEEHYVIFF